MKDSENIYDKIRELIGKDPGSVSIMEDIIDVDLQVEYFEYSRSILTEFDGDAALQQMSSLAEEGYSINTKKKILARLATMDDVSAFRAIEAYASDPDEELREWSLLALQESRMHLESHLLEENQVFISTGLGGKDNKLRYYVVLIARNRKKLTSFQKKIIGNEFPYILKKYDGEIEEIEVSGSLAALLLLLPIQYAVKEVFSQGIEECNQYGDFLRETCIVTNVKKLTFDEVEEFMERNKDTNADATG
ncbi:MAG: hypothetical protein K9G38_06280 [Bacteroidales bacterium]|nr:hypothetical protein [Bacteroidales bacterium]